jgi:3-hydroxyisobutyrate dehydrogenase-like beta-hydroxyacid dehydrogenase
VTKVGFIGLGALGKLIAINEAKAEFDLMVYDLREEPMRELAALGAKVARSARELAEHGDIIQIVVQTDQQVEAVMFGEEGVLAGARPGSVIAIHSTVHPNTIRKVAAAARAKDVGLIDAEVSGGNRGAEARTMSFMVGGDEACLEQCRPVFTASGTNIFHMGPLGSGATTKLVHQIIAIGTMMSVAEGMLLAQAAGLDPHAVEQVVRVSDARSHMADSWWDFFRLKPLHTVTVLQKCLVPALELAQELGVSLPATALAQQLIPLRITGAEGPPPVDAQS